MYFQFVDIVAVYNIIFFLLESANFMSVQDAQQTRREKEQHARVTDIPENQKKNSTLKDQKPDLLQHMTAAETLLQPPKLMLKYAILTATKTSGTAYYCLSLETPAELRAPIAANRLLDSIATRKTDTPVMATDSNTTSTTEPLWLPPLPPHQRSTD